MGLSTNLETDRNKVLVITGGYLSAEDQSILRNLGKQVSQWRESTGGWLELKIKANVAELLSATRGEAKRSQGLSAVVALKKTRKRISPPELTEVVLATALKAENMDFGVAGIEALFQPAWKLAKFLRDYDCIFLSTTLIRDESELDPLLKRIKKARPAIKIVLGGAYAGPLAEKSKPLMGTDVLAVGYGEMLVPTLCAWIRSGFQTLEAPVGGRLSKVESMYVLHSGSPKSKDLDFLPTPDWQLAEKIHDQKFELIHYESVRGCPYRCRFCNYPFLFDDSKFRMKSAQKIANDWEVYYRQGVKHISCLDSLFTMPRSRLEELCHELIKRGVRLQWSCYARSGDLTDLEVVSLMKRAGCNLVQIGFESGDQQILNNMNKRTTVEENELALQNCRKAELTSVVSLIVGFPGETDESIQRTFVSLERARPDFFFVATFSTRVENVPILSPECRAEFGLETHSNQRTVSPYWKHRTMNCTEAAHKGRDLGRKLIREKISLEASSFYQSISTFSPSQRGTWLEFQKRALERNTLKKRVQGWIWDRFHCWVDRRLQIDFGKWPTAGQL